MFVQNNTVTAIRSYLKDNLETIYDARESDNIVGWLFQHFMGWSKHELRLNENQTLTESELLLFHKALKRLQKQEPIQYVLGECEFYGRTFRVNESVLIPRPETEELVALILAENNKQILKVLDIGTGSGCIPITLKLERPEWEISAVDNSRQAIEMACSNASVYGVAVDWVCTDFLKYPDQQWSDYDIIVSNPPILPIPRKGR